MKTKVGNHRTNRNPQALKADLKYGDYALVSRVAARVSAAEIEAARRTITGNLQRAGRLWIRAFPDIPVTGKPTDSRMGKGKGAVKYWVARVQPGQILYELTAVEKSLAFRALNKASKKFPFPTRALSRFQPLE